MPGRIQQLKAERKKAADEINLLIVPYYEQTENFAKEKDEHFRAILELERIANTFSNSNLSPMSIDKSYYADSLNSLEEAVRINQNVIDIAPRILSKERSHFMSHPKLLQFYDSVQVDLSERFHYLTIIYVNILYVEKKFFYYGSAEGSQLLLDLLIKLGSFLRKDLRSQYIEDLNYNQYFCSVSQALFDYQVEIHKIKQMALNQVEGAGQLFLCIDAASQELDELTVELWMKRELEKIHELSKEKLQALIKRISITRIKLDYLKQLDLLSDAAKERVSFSIEKLDIIQNIKIPSIDNSGSLAVSQTKIESEADSLEPGVSKPSKSLKSKKNKAKKNKAKKIGSQTLSYQEAEVLPGIETTGLEAVAASVSRVAIQSSITPDPTQETVRDIKMLLSSKKGILKNLDQIEFRTESYKLAGEIALGEFNKGCFLSYQAKIDNLLSSMDLSSSITSELDELNQQLRKEIERLTEQINVAKFQQFVYFPDEKKLLHLLEVDPHLVINPQPVRKLKTKESDYIREYAIIFSKLNPTTNADEEIKWYLHAHYKYSLEGEERYQVVHLKNAEQRYLGEVNYNASPIHRRQIKFETFQRILDQYRQSSRHVCQPAHDSREEASGHNRVKGLVAS